mmetsp:Transcript_18026/g.55199  ORF Transcript_18026/g.55199 Transcript_18026/m.55199 type:complete len:357 (+) Transcript_18026:202-1272(+)
MANLDAGGDVLPTQAPEDFDAVPMTQLPGDFSDGVLYLSYSVTPGLASFALREGVEYSVGRLDDADIRLYDDDRRAEEQQIHRQHAVLLVDRDLDDDLCLLVRSKASCDDTLFVHDSAVRPGTHVTLSVGDSVSFGARRYTRFRFEVTAEPRTLPPTSPTNTTRTAAAVPPTPTDLSNHNTPNINGNSTTRGADMATQLAQRAQRFGIDQRLPTARGPPKSSRALRHEAAARKAADASAATDKSARERELEKELAAERKRSRERLKLQAKQARRAQATAVNRAVQAVRAQVAARRDHGPPSNDQKKRRRREQHSDHDDQPPRGQKKRRRGTDHDDQSTLLPTKTKRQRARGHSRRH